MIDIKPFLKWAGNKYRCLKHILESFPAANRLIEPFTGSAAVFLNTNYSDYLLGEANLDLISLFQQLKTEKESFIDYCKPFFSQANNNSIQYYNIRHQFNLCKNTRDRAAMFLYLNRHGYNGLCRYNQQGIYNVPFGQYVKPYFPEKEMRFFYQKCQQTSFIHSDFRATFNLAQPGDLIYCDPPYAPLEQRSNFSTYTNTKFGEAEQIILADLAKESAARGIPVILSNHDTEFTRQQYEKADIKSFMVIRSINCQGNQRGFAKELIAIFR